MADFQSQLKKLRRSRNISQGDMGNILHCSRFRVADLERGKISPTIEDINILCDFFNVPSDYILGRCLSKADSPEIMQLCDFLGLNDDALFSIHQHLNLNKSNSVGDVLVDRMISETDTISIDFADWNSKDIDDVTESELLNMLLKMEDFYNLLSNICSYRNHLAKTISDPISTAIVFWAESEKKQFECYRMYNRIKRDLFSALEKKADARIKTPPGNDNEEFLEDEEDGNE